MLHYILKRLLTLAFTVLLLSLVFFAIISAVPGSFAQTGILSGTSVERIEELNRIYGLDKPFLRRYADWLSSFLRFDFGNSFIYKKPVAEVLFEHSGYSFTLAFLALIAELVIAIPAGALSAYKNGRRTDAVISFLAVCLISAPVFFLGVTLKKWFAFDLLILPSSGFSSAGVELSPLGRVADVSKHLILPVLTLALLNSGALIRYTKNALLAELSKDYILTARAKRLPERVVVLKHGLRNALLPLVTYVGSSVPALFSGAVIVESLFAIPGVGKLAYDAAMVRDYPLLMGYTMMLTVVTLVCNLGVDLLYRAIDPKVRLVKGGGSHES